MGTVHYEHFVAWDSCKCIPCSSLHKCCVQKLWSSCYSHFCSQFSRIHTVAVVLLAELHLVTQKRHNIHLEAHQGPHWFVALSLIQSSTIMPEKSHWPEIRESSIKESIVMIVTHIPTDNCDQLRHNNHDYSNNSHSLHLFILD